MYKVQFCSKREGLLMLPWEPAEGDGVTCLEKEAMQRFEHLLAEGRAKRKVDGEVPWSVEIVDEQGKVCLGMTTEPGDDPVGLWVNRLRAAA